MSIFVRGAELNITIFGSGYVGLVTGACLADVGHHVVCVDVDEGKIERLKQGIIPIYEPGLEILILANIGTGNLVFTNSAAEAVRHGEVIFIAVGTPSGLDGDADLRYVLAVAETIGQHAERHKIVVNKSTVPVGTAEKVRSAIQVELSRRDLDLSFDVCSNPEFLKEGAAIEDFTKGSRIVVGTDSDRALQALRRVYAPYNRNHEKMIVMDVRSAELTKYAANAMLATKISFINEISKIAEALDADIEMVRLGIGSDPRIGYHFIYPGVGYGGSCFPKDLRALALAARKSGVPPSILEAVETVNNRQKSWTIDRLKQIFGDLAGRRIAVWGLAFKPMTDDMREAPSRVLLEALFEVGADVSAFDPEAMGECRRLYGDRADLALHDTAESALTGADAVVICTEWKMFRAASPQQFVSRLKQPVVVDGRNLYDPRQMRDAGIIYHCVGRPTLG